MKNRSIFTISDFWMKLRAQMYTAMDKHTDQWLPWPVLDFNMIRAE